MKALWLLVGMILLLISGLVALYFFYEKPKQEEILLPQGTHNLSLLYRLANGTQVSTGYSIFLDNQFERKGITPPQGYVREELQTNKTILILNSNQERQRFYVFYASLEKSDIPNNYRAELTLTPYGNLTLNHTGVFGVDRTLNLTLSSPGYVRNLSLCLQWSLNLIVVTPGTPEHSYERIDPPKRYLRTADRCYDLGVSLDDQNHSITIPLTYKAFKQFNSLDFIRVYAMDSDLRLRGQELELSVEESTGEDLGREDVLYVIT